MKNLQKYSTVRVLSLYCHGGLVSSYYLSVQVNKYLQDARSVLYHFCTRGVCAGFTDRVEANMASTAMMALAAASEARKVADETPLKNQFLAFYRDAVLNTLSTLVVARTTSLLDPERPSWVDHDHGMP